MTLVSMRVSFSLTRSCLVALLVSALAVAGVTIAPAPATAAESPSGKDKRGKDKRDKHDKAEQPEMEAREAFAAGRYQDALDRYAKLYAETLHPTYLRNIGRCYMNMEQPERAVSSFREYLRKAKDLTDAEKAEVEGFIGEMENVRKQKEAATVATAKPVDPTPAPPPAFVADPPRPQPAPVPESDPFYNKGWFWGVVGGVVVVGVLGGLWAAGVFNGKKTCPSGYVCD